MKRRDFLKKVVATVALANIAPQDLVMPAQEPVGYRMMGIYAWEEPGFAVMDNRRILLGSF